MKVLITAGSTMTPIDRVRGINNIFRGKTGLQIARYFHSRGADVTLLLASDLYKSLRQLPNFPCKTFRTFDQLERLMAHEIKSRGYDTVIHSAAVNDYELAQVSVLHGKRFIPVKNNGKISSKHKRIRLELVQTIKIIDQIRRPWGFPGKLVKFKLEVGISDRELVEIARESMNHSGADMIVANCLEWYKERAYIIEGNGFCMGISRNALAPELYRRLK